MKVELDNNTPVILTNHKEVEKSLDGAKEAYKLACRTLEGKERVTYELRIWIDERYAIDCKNGYIHLVFDKSIIKRNCYLSNKL